MFVSLAWSRHDIISACIVKVKLRRHLEFLCDEQATELVKRFTKKKKKMYWQKALTFYRVSSTSKTKLYSNNWRVSLIDTDSNFERVNNMIVITYIAHELRAEYSWQRFLIFVIPKYFFEGMFANTKKVVQINYLVNVLEQLEYLVVRRLWTHFTQAKV